MEVTATGLSAMWVAWFSRVVWGGVAHQTNQTINQPKTNQADEFPSAILPADSLISRRCAMNEEPSLLPGQLRQLRRSGLSVTSTLQSVNRWRHNEYSCCSHPSRSYSCKAHLLSRSDQWSDCQTWCGKMTIFQCQESIIEMMHHWDDANPSLKQRWPNTWLECVRPGQWMTIADFQLWVRAH